MDQTDKYYKMSKSEFKALFMRKQRERLQKKKRDYFKYYGII